MKHLLKIAKIYNRVSAHFQSTHLRPFKTSKNKTNKLSVRAENGQKLDIDGKYLHIDMI